MVDNERYEAVMWRAEKEYTIRVDIVDGEGVRHFLGYYVSSCAVIESENECFDLGYWYRSNRLVVGKPYAEVRVYTGREMDATDITRSVYRFYAENIDAE